MSRPQPLPRILCLHGGGVNAEVFHIQCRALIVALRPYFRLVFVDAPFISPGHQDIMAVYGDHGPFRRWLRWLPGQPEIDPETAIGQIRYQIHLAMEEDDDAVREERVKAGFKVEDGKGGGGFGDWVGVLGFSQGAKVAASMLYAQQLRNERKIKDEDGEGGIWGLNLQFGVLMAGRAPLVMLDANIPIPAGIADAGQASALFTEWPDSGATEHVLKLPTIHVHGMRDPGLEYHRKMLHDYCKEGTARLIEWDGGHRLPIKKHDVDAVIGLIVVLGQELGLVEE